MRTRHDGGYMANRNTGDRMPDDGGDPMESMGNLFDIGILIGVGLLVFALSGLGLREMLGKSDVTIVKNPGTPSMEIITKDGNQVKRLKAGTTSAEGTGTAVGTVYQLGDGRMIWIPQTPTPTQ